MDYVTRDVLIAVGFLLVVEAWALISRDRPITGSARRYGRLWLIWPATGGVLFGHFWWPWPSVPYGWIALLLIAAGVAWSDARHRLSGRAYPRWAPIVAVEVGIPLGGLLWSGGY